MYGVDRKPGRGDYRDYRVARGRRYVSRRCDLLVFAPPYKVGLAIRQIREIGADWDVSIVLIAASIGAVLGLQGVNTLTRFGAEGSLGSVVSLVLVRELGPVMAALMVTARAGFAMAAELGSMQATEQIDALTVMAINPVQYLVSPRIVAGVVSFPLLTSVFDVVGIIGGTSSAWA